MQTGMADVAWISTNAHSLITAAAAKSALTNRAIIRVSVSPVSC